MYSQYLRQIMVYWAVTGINDGFGKPIFATPVEVPCKWEDKNEMVIDMGTGEEILALSKVFVDEDLSYGSMVFLGELTDLTTEQKTDPYLSEAQTIRGKSTITALIGNAVTRYIWTGQNRA